MHLEAREPPPPQGADGHHALDLLYWRAEILQAMYWMRGEGLATDVEARRLAEFLGADAATVQRHLRQLAIDGYVEVIEETGDVDGASAARSDGHPLPTVYRLTSFGLAEGKRSFDDEFADYIHQAHGECGRGCWCKDPAHAGEPCPNEGPRTGP